MLDVSHDSFSGTYSSFRNFRYQVAEAAGFGNLMEYEGYGGDKTFPDDPLSILLSHSDCDGEISWQDLPGIIQRLEQIVPAMDESDRILQMIAGFKRAVKNQENIEFL